MKVWRGALHSKDLTGPYAHLWTAISHYRSGYDSIPKEHSRFTLKILGHIGLQFKKWMACMKQLATPLTDGIQSGNDLPQSRAAFTVCHGLEANEKHSNP